MQRPATTRFEVMNQSFFQWLAVIDTGCWLICFWWMHRISSRQDAMLQELRGQAARIEELSKAEHDLVKEMHPKVASIEGDLSEVAEAVRG
ncbi:MAG: hypothetical protein QOE70_6352 [Chthoniobacter sp.]|jgi:heme exporter protein D|nr:hypothetical protein [Chthoniobacter sp.]